MLKFEPELLLCGQWVRASADECAFYEERLENEGGCELFQLEAGLSVDRPFEAFRLRCSQGLDGYECVYKTHLSPVKGMVIGEKAFRSPAVVLEKDGCQLALIPDLDDLEKEHPLPFFMDYAVDEGIYYGVGPQRETGHVYYELTGTQVPGAKLRFSFYLARFSMPLGKKRDFRPLVRLLWELFGEKRMTEPSHPQSLLPYAQTVYGWAFDRWKDVTWQEFSMNGKTVGGVVFLVTASQKPGHGGESVWREPKSLWNQAWFCSLRSAYGYYRYGRDFHDPKLLEYGERALGFALSAPRQNGLFASYYQAGEDQRMETGHWVFSAPRRPQGHEEFVHLLDNSWTCLWLLKWYEEIKPEPEILRMVQDYADSLLALERPDGSYPAWVRPDTQEASPYLADSPECAAHCMLFCALYRITGEERLLEAAERTAGFLLDSVMPNGRWEDFETYWSCSKEWEYKRYGQRDPRSGLYCQCNFSIYWCCEAFLALYELKRDFRYLEAGEKALAELSLYQQLCRPWDFVPQTLGGFGVMNTDDEWNDARQSLFALTYLRYYRATGREEYRLRALYSMKASFYMMYCPENPELKRLYEQVHPHFDQKDYGFMMENFNHSDGTKKLGLGEFTIFDWGNGAACASLMEVLSLYPENESKT